MVCGRFHEKPAFVPCRLQPFPVNRGLKGFFRNLAHIGVRREKFAGVEEKDQFIQPGHKQFLAVPGFQTYRNRVRGADRGWVCYEGCETLKGGPEEPGESRGPETESGISRRIQETEFL